MFLAAAPNMTWLELLEWQNLFPGVDALIAKAQIPFFLAAFVMLVGYVATTISKQNGRFDIGEYARPFVLAILAAVAIGSINEVVPKGMEIGKAMAQEMGGTDFKGVVQEIWESSSAFLPTARGSVNESTAPDATTMSRDAYIANRQEAYMRANPGLSVSQLASLREALGNEWDAATRQPGVMERIGGWVSNTMNSVRDGVYTVFGTLLRMIFCLIIYVLLAVSALVMAVMLLMQQVIIRFGAIFLPVFIAGLLTGYFRTQAINYCTGMIGVMLWPLGWAFVNIGTISLTRAVMATVRTILTPVSMGVSGAGGRVLDSIVNGQTMPFQYMGTLFIAIVGALLILAWILVGMIGGAYALQKMVTSGASIAQSMVTGAANAAMSAAGAGLSTAGFLAASKLAGAGALAGGAGGLDASASGSAESSVPPPLPKSVPPPLPQQGGGDKDGPQNNATADGNQTDSKGGGGGSGGGGGGGGGKSFGQRFADGLATAGPMTLSALGKTFQNAANSDGSPETAHRVPDTGFNETMNAMRHGLEAARAKARLNKTD